MLLSAAVSLIASVVMLVFSLIDGMPAGTASLWMTAPLIVCGAIYWLRSRAWMMLVAVAATIVAFIIPEIPREVAVIIMLVLFAAPGTAALSCSIQRKTFFKVVGCAQSANLKEKPSIFERLVRFLFDLPQCIDLRMMSVKRPMRRKLPLRDIVALSLTGAMMSSVFWFYMAADRAFQAGVSDAESLTLIIVMAQIIPLAILPAAVYRTMDAGLDTNAGKYRMHLGLRGTAVRTMLPFMLLSVVAIAILSRENFAPLMTSIVLVTAASFAMTFLASMMYSVLMEASVANDIMAKWKIFRPTTLLSGMDGGEENVPGTPERES